MKKLFALLLTLMLALCAASALAEEPDPTPLPEYFDELFALRDRAVTDKDGEAPGYEAYTGRMIVAIYPDVDASSVAPDVITSESEDTRGIPREYLADSWKQATRAVLIFPQHADVGIYTGGGIARSTTTWMTVFNLSQDIQYHATKVAHNDPPQTIQTRKIGGMTIPMGAAGKYETDAAIALLVERAEEARAVKSTPAETPRPAGKPRRAGQSESVAPAETPEPTPEPTEEPTPEPTEKPTPTPEPTATPLPEDLAALYGMLQDAKDYNGENFDEAMITGDVIVAIYLSTSEGITPTLLTAESEDERDFPREYRAASYDTARWAAIIYPTYRQVGWYSGVAGGAANETTTWMCLFDLQTAMYYKTKVAVANPPQIITVQTYNGIPMNSGASGRFHIDQALEKLAEAIEDAQTKPTPTPEPTEEPTPEPTEEPTPEPTEEPAPTPTEEPTPEPAGDISVDAVLDALGEDVYRATYDALLAGETVQKGSKGETARGVQQTLIAFGQGIAADGSVGAKTIAALNAVQDAFGLEQTESLDAEGFAALLPRLLATVDPDEAEALLRDGMDAGEYAYIQACACVAQGKFYSAKQAFEESGWGDFEARAEACVQPWPRTGELYKNPDVKGSATRLTVQFNSDPDVAMLVKIYTTDDVLARTMFIGGTGKATTSLPAGTYIIKDGTGNTWYGEDEAFGEEGYYEIMTFGGGEQEIELEKNYASTITVNVQEANPDAEGVGSDWESWDEF